MAFDTTTNDFMIKALGIESLPKDKQDVILERSGALIYQSVVTRGLEELSEDAVNRFERLIAENPSPEGVIAFFEANISNFDKMIEEETKAFIERGQE